MYPLIGSSAGTLICNDKQGQYNMETKATYTRKCANPDCISGGEFTSEDPRRRYCCDECQKKAQNRRNYERTRETRIEKVIERRKAKKQADPS